ncbi:MAG: cytochrome ubiquinol oxidase subunit I [Rickettsiales bacterium]|nr:cytochrome ubiquinol oxidase subunit I [Rickettsiales bacterium]
MEFGLVEISRLQFAVTAIYHFLFVPLTLGLAVILAIMESVYVMTGKEIWRDITKFWGKLFAINFAMGVATGITMEFQFGTNWAYYSHYVGDIFGVPLAIEGLMAFFLESTFVGMFLFGWNKMSKRAHLVVTWLMAIGTNLSALWILIANGWMQNPVGAKFNAETMRMELDSFKEIFFNEVAQSKFVHTISAGYVTGAMFVLAISCYYLLKKTNVQVAKRSIIVASSFGLLAALSVVVLGDESGYSAGQNQKMKIAAIEGMWETEEAPADFTVFAIPNEATQTNEYSVKLPYVLGLIATRSLDKEVPGIKDLINVAEARVKNGIGQYLVLKNLRSKNSQNPEADKAYLRENYQDIGYALLLKKYRADIENSTEAEIRAAAESTKPRIAPLFYSFRIMVGLGLYFIILFAVAFWQMNVKRNFDKKLLLKICFYSLPLPWIAAELGWIVAECGRQPWVIEGILPTALGISPVSYGHVLASLTGFVILYTALLVVDLYLMVKYTKLGPDKLLSKNH